MLVSFFESFKYVGHLFPVALLRVYIGYFYLDEAIVRLRTDFLTYPHMADEAMQWLPRGLAPEWYGNFINDFLVPNWQYCAHFFVAAEILVGVSFLIGYFVRPMGLLGIFLNLNFLWIFGPEKALFFKTMIATQATLVWVGAGRCFGVDYFFYKRRRGIWW